jgi:diadenosine tetraphosphate (Ap4A) HIT family hydrolase
MFTLDPRLRNDTVALGHFPLSLVLLMNDRAYPWLILVPRREGVREIYELDALDQQQLLRESSHLAKILTASFHPDKLNIAALGNIVPQLHLHHVVRFRHDPAWPAPVWGKAPAVPYSPEEMALVRDRLTPSLDNFTPIPDSF